MKTQPFRVLIALLISALLVACGGVQKPAGGGPGGPPPSGEPLEGLQRTTVAVGAQHTVVLTNEGLVQVAGKRNSGNLGDNVPVGTGERNQPVTLASLPVMASVAAGNRHSLALTETGQLWVWGSNASYQLGFLSELVNQYKPVAVPLGVPLRAIAAGGDVSAGIDTSGNLWLWGNDPTRLLPGSGPHPMGLAPGKTAGLPPALSVSIGRDVILVAGEDGSLWEIGERPRGGVSVPVQLDLPVGVGEAKVVGVAVGPSLLGRQALALLDDGRVLGWGSSANGMLGSEHGSLVEKPALLSALDGHSVFAVHAGPGVSAFVTESGDLMLMGRGADGLLGTGGTDNSGVPTVVLEGVSSFALGAGPYAVANTADGVYAWGQADAALGLGELIEQVNTPTRRD